MNGLDPDHDEIIERRRKNHRKAIGCVGLFWIVMGVGSVIVMAGYGEVLSWIAAAVMILLGVVLVSFIVYAIAMENM